MCVSYDVTGDAIVKVWSENGSLGWSPLNENIIDSYIFDRGLHSSVIVYASCVLIIINMSTIAAITYWAEIRAKKPN